MHFWTTFWEWKRQLVNESGGFVLSLHCTISELRTFLNIGQNTILKAILYFNKNLRQEKMQVWDLVVPWLMGALRHFYFKLSLVLFRGGFYSLGQYIIIRFIWVRDVGFFWNVKEWGLKESRQIIFKKANIGRVKVWKLIFLKLSLFRCPVGSLRYLQSYIHLFEHCCLERLCPFGLAPVLP